MDINIYKCEMRYYSKCRQLGQGIDTIFTYLVVNFSKISIVIEKTESQIVSLFIGNYPLPDCLLLISVL